MNILITILLIIAAIILLLLIIALFMKKKYIIQTEVLINSPCEKVFNYVKLLKNQDNFNKWVMVDPEMKKIFKGIDGTAGFIYGWSGNKKAGEGEQEIKSITEGEKIDTVIRFIRPFPGIANVSMITEQVSANQTKATWNIASEMKYPMNIMLPVVEKMLAKDMEASLQKLKNILEKL